MSKLNNLLLTGRNIWTLDDMSAIWGQTKRSDTVQSAKKYAKSGSLRRIHRGVYALPNVQLNQGEIAGKLVVPSYLSGETVLKKQGASFQLSNHITSVALKSRRVILANTTYVYYQLSPSIFYNSLGINKAEASIERAVADLIYLFGGRYSFEDLSGVNWGKLLEIGTIYGKKSVLENIRKLQALYA